MDITKESPRILSLCSGYGGIERGLSRVFGSVSVLAHVEVEAFAVANLVNKMEKGHMVPAPVWTDLKTLNAKSFRGRVDWLTGGYPCQPFSAAGKRKGSDDPRHLWPFIGGRIGGRENIIEQCKPRGVFFENVEGHLSLGVCEVLADLERMGYTATAGIFSAAEVGAPHQRKRVFILGYSDSFDGGTSPEGRGHDTEIRQTSAELAEPVSEGPQRHPRNEQRAGRPEVRSHRSTSESGVPLWPARPGEDQHEWEAPRVVGDSSSAGPSVGTSGQVAESEGTKSEPERPAAGSERKTKSRLGRATNGPACRVDRLRLLGNGVVPQVAEKAFRVLYEELIDGR